MPASNASLATILHLSDLHFGADHAFASDPSATLIATIADDLADTGLAPDCVVVSGDLTTHGDISGLATAARSLLALQRRHRLHVDDFVIVPGNHDIDFKALAKLPKRADAETKRATAFAHYESFWKSFYGRRRPDKWYTRYWTNGHVFLLGLNSCLRESPEHRGMGLVELEQLRMAARRSASLWSRCQIRIAALHHHLVPVTWTNDRDSMRQHSLTLNTVTVMEELARYGFGVVLHGHQHQPLTASETRYWHMNSPSGSVRSNLVLLGVGSAGAKRDRLGPISKRHYQILTPSPGLLGIRSRVVDSAVSERFEDFQSFTIPLSPALIGPQLTRVLLEREHKTFAPLQPTATGPTAMIDMPADSLVSFMPRALCAAGFICDSITVIGDEPLRPLKMETRSLPMDARLRRVIVPMQTKATLPKSLRQEKLFQLSRRAYREISKSVFPLIRSELGTIVSASDDPLLRALQSNRLGDVSIARFGHAGDSFIAFAYRNVPDNLVRFVFEPPLSLLVAIDSLFERVFRSARPLYNTVRSKASVPTVEVR